MYKKLMLVMILVLLILSATASSHTEEIKRLAQQNAILEHRVRRLESLLCEKGADPAAPAGGGPDANG